MELKNLYLLGHNVNVVFMHNIKLMKYNYRSKMSKRSAISPTTSGGASVYRSPQTRLSQNQVASVDDGKNKTEKIYYRH